MKLHRFPGMTDEPVVIRNLRYWGAPRNDGFVMMPNDVEAYRTGPNAFEFKGTNGFMITVDLNSKDFGSLIVGGTGSPLGPGAGWCAPADSNGRPTDS